MNIQLKTRLVSIVAPLPCGLASYNDWVWMTICQGTRASTHGRIPKMRSVATVPKGIVLHTG